MHSNHFCLLLEGSMLFASSFLRVHFWNSGTFEVTLFLLPNVYLSTMGKSPGKWIKTVLFGKKSSKLNLSKDATLNKKTPITTNSQARDFSADSVVISSPVLPVIDASGERTQLEKSSSANLTHDTAENVRNTLGLNTASDDELIRLEQAATKAQAAFRGYLARRAFWALKGIIRLQALVRGHLVRRQAVATLSCMRAIVEFQALVRGQKARLSGNCQTLQKKVPRELVHKERANLLQTSLRSEKLSTNTFGAKLVASSNSTMPLSIQYDPAEPNSVRSWLERWSTSHFWDPLLRPKKTLDAKPKRKQTKLQSEETETGRPKRSVRRVPAANLDSNPLNSSEIEKPKRTARKVSSIQAESVPEQSHSELEKVKRNLRKISVPAPGVSEKSEIETEKLPIEKVFVPEPCPDEPFEKVNEADNVVAEPLPAPPMEEKPLDVIPPPVETNGKVENESRLNAESNGKENQKTRRRKSFPVKQEYSESVSQNSPTLPSYMAATESAKAKLRAQAAEDGGENGSARRHSLPSSISKLSLQSPRVQKPLQANSKGGVKTNKLQISPRDEKVLTSGWRR